MTTTSAGTVEFADAPPGFGEAGKLRSLLARRPGGNPASAAIYLYDGDFPGISTECGSNGDLILVRTLEDLKDAGTATGGTPRTLTAAGAGWTPNAFAGLRVALGEGSGVGEVRSIVANSSDTLTLDRDLGASITSGYTYFIVKGAVRTTHYRYHTSGIHRNRAPVEGRLRARSGEPPGVGRGRDP